MVVIVDNVTSKSAEGNDSDDSDEVIMKAAKGIERDIKDLLMCAQDSWFVLWGDHWLLKLCYSTLKMINEELDKITAQGPWLLGIYRDLNASAVDGCLDRLSTALEKFKVRPASDAHDLGGWHHPFSSSLTIFVIPTSSKNSMPV